jgi:hypothetical protein
MKRIGTIAAALSLLAACDNGGRDEGEHGPARGRYVGIGTFPANELWPKLAAVAMPTDPKAATLADDRQIIVTVDSQTGEVRQCGDLSGHCIAMNPWRSDASAAPAGLTTHTADLADERGAHNAASTDLAGDAQAETAPKPKP